MPGVKAGTVDGEEELQQQKKKTHRKQSAIAILPVHTQQQLLHYPARGLLPLPALLAGFASRFRLDMVTQGSRIDLCSWDWPRSLRWGGKQRD
jgi:hypothetical protein